LNFLFVWLGKRIEEKIEEKNNKQKTKEMELFSSSVLASAGKETKKLRETHDDDTTKTITIVPNEEITASNALVSASSRDNTHNVAFSFAELGVADWLCQTTTSLGYKRPSIVQSSCIPGILQGKDVMACAETGSGKTATFVLPMLQILAQDPYGIFGVILTPTRELALQIAEQISALGASLQVTTALVIGGMNMIQQSLQLSRRPHFVIATPGRLRAHLEGADPPNISRARFLVLDEADRLLALGFASELAVILRHINPRRQTLLFSATLTNTLEELQSLALRDGATLRHNSTIQQIGNEGDGKSEVQQSHQHGRQLPATLTQQYVVVPAKLKLCFLVLLLSKFFAPSSSPTDSASDAPGMKKKLKESGGGVVPEVLTLSEAIASKKARDDPRYRSHYNKSNQPYDAGKLHIPRPQHQKGQSQSHFNGNNFAAIEQILKKNKSTSSSSSGNSGRLSQIIIFVESCSRCHELSLTIQELLRQAHRRGFALEDSSQSELCCVALHGMLTQSQRLQSLQAFRDVTARILIATDVASRGLDLQAVDLVISYDLPRVAADYVHRAGRTARAGRRGTSTTFVTPHDIALLQAIETACETRLVAREDLQLTDTQPLLLPVSKAVQTIQLAILSSDFQEKEERFKERKREQKKKEQRKFGSAEDASMGVDRDDLVAKESPEEETLRSMASTKQTQEKKMKKKRSQHELESPDHLGSNVVTKKKAKHV
jgi:superfamily II DNA/RNA helicase